MKYISVAIIDITFAAIYASMLIVLQDLLGVTHFGYVQLWVACLITVAIGLVISGHKVAGEMIKVWMKATEGKG